MKLLQLLIAVLPIAVCSLHLDEIILPSHLAGYDYHYDDTCLAISVADIKYGALTKLPAKNSDGSWSRCRAWIPPKPVSHNKYTPGCDCEDRRPEYTLEQLCEAVVDKQQILDKNKKTTWKSHYVIDVISFLKRQARQNRCNVPSSLSGRGLTLYQFVIWIGYYLD